MHKIAITPIDILGKKYGYKYCKLSHGMKYTMSHEKCIFFICLQTSNNISSC